MPASLRCCAMLVVSRLSFASAASDSLNIGVDGGALCGARYWENLFVMYLRYASFAISLYWVWVFRRRARVILRWLLIAWLTFFLLLVFAFQLFPSYVLRWAPVTDVHTVTSASRFGDDMENVHVHCSGERVTLYNTFGPAMSVSHFIWYRWFRT